MITRLARNACAVLALSAAGLVPAGAASLSPKAPNPFLPFEVKERSSASIGGNHAVRSSDAEPARLKLLDDFLEALRVMQDDYFEPWLGQWPKAIDWTAAVMGTYVAGALSSLSGGLTVDDGLRQKENLITTYFSQILSYYFGQDAFAIRNEAYDDMLWVVLGWLEAVEFIDYHTTLYRDSKGDDAKARGTTAGGVSVQDIKELRNQSWYGNLWIPAFSHRARIFWDIASQGWDTKLCGGGMVWNPRLTPYKNAITNELYIAASASMYLYFPGDSNPSPFTNALDPRVEDPNPDPNASREPHEAKHLKAALAGYHWLANSGMKDDQGLYTDGFHISNWNNVTNPNTRCDERNDMVYTYNQGVVLTGQIGLWKVTGDTHFLSDGHQLIQSVINATGYDLDRDQPVDNIGELAPGQLPPWHGLGRAGVLEEQCDASGQCSQDSQTFKGIFFHHLTAFCAPLDIGFSSANTTTTTTAATSSKDMGELHKRSAAAHLDACSRYVGWIRHNAEAALATRDSGGKFGMWWTAGLLQINVSSAAAAPPNPSSGPNSVDYRTYGVPNNTTWVPAPAHAGPPPMREQFEYNNDQTSLASGRTKHAPAGKQGTSEDRMQPRFAAGDPSDPNTRGRGRTVETQGGGLSVLRSLWEISQYNRFE